jgi:hypothetical protein
MLTLVTNRKSVYWGGDLELEEGPSKYFQPGSGNDFIYAAGLVVVVDEMNDFGWGSAYLTTLFIRPIPRSLWPSKYDDAAKFFGKSSAFDENLGVDIRAYHWGLGWTAARGAAAGIVGDMWREFAWAMLIPLFGAGWAYSHVWRRAVSRQGIWVPVYCFMASLSLFFVMQSLQAMLQRFLFGALPMIIVLRLAMRATSPGTNEPQLASAPSATKVVGP